MTFDDFHWMRQALDFAKKASEQSEVPVGAVIVDAKNQFLAGGWNQVIKTHDPSAHAEIIALRKAGIQKKNHRLLNATLYVTLEPCCMCAGALVHSRVKRLVFSCRDLKAGAAGSVYNLLQGFPLNHKIQIDEGCLQEESSILLNNFFKSRR